MTGQTQTIELEGERFHGLRHEVLRLTVMAHDGRQCGHFSAAFEGSEPDLIAAGVAQSEWFATVAKRTKTGRDEFGDQWQLTRFSKKWRVVRWTSDSDGGPRRTMKFTDAEVLQGEVPGMLKRFART